MGTSVMSREAAAALMCKLGCLTELLQSKARAKVPTALHTDHRIHYTNLMKKMKVSSIFYSSGSQLASQDPKNGLHIKTIQLFCANLSVGLGINTDFIPIHKLSIQCVYFSYSINFASKNQSNEDWD